MKALRSSQQLQSFCLTNSIKIENLFLNKRRTKLLQERTSVDCQSRVIHSRSDSLRTVFLMVKTTSAIHHARRILAQGPYYSCDPSLLLKAAANVKLAPNLKIFVIPLHPRSPFVSQSGKVILPQVAKAPLPNLDSLVARQETTQDVFLTSLKANSWRTRVYM